MSAKRAVQRGVVSGLESACTVVDRLTPDWRWYLPGRVCRLAGWSAKLDERWDAGVWRTDQDGDVAADHHTVIPPADKRGPDADR